MRDSYAIWYCELTSSSQDRRPEPAARNFGLGENLRIPGCSVYFSVVTFTTLGYGDMVALGWGKAIAVVEAFVGVFLSSMFLLTFVKKMIR